MKRADRLRRLLIGNGSHSQLIKIYLLLGVFCLKTGNANKYCAFEIDGVAKYYICPKNENCCSIGCCVNLAFHFYQLWYYWLLVLFMFMVCSGGGWWYRFCRSPHATISSRYPSTTAAAAHLNNSLNPYHRHHHHHHSHLHHSSASLSPSSSPPPLPSDMHHYQHSAAAASRPMSRVRQHRPCGQRQTTPTYYLQRLWKQPNIIPQQPLPPSYSTMFVNVPLSNSSDGHAVERRGGTSAAGSLVQSTCQYFQLYGPPPSYDSVIQITPSGMTNCRLLAAVCADDNETTAGVQSGQPSLVSSSNVDRSSVSDTNCEDMPMIGDEPHACATATTALPNESVSSVDDLTIISRDNHGRITDNSISEVMKSDLPAEVMPSNDS